MEVLHAIRTRRSVREFKQKKIERDKIEKILEAGRWAPSAKNRQPWKFIVVEDEKTIKQVASCTIYSFVGEAPLLIAVFLDRSEMIDRVKDVQAIGACIQNMLLAIHALGLGGVWIGEILKRKEEVNRVLDAPDYLELMAVISAGYPIERKRSSSRKDLKEITYKEKFRIPFKA
jgi:nitroreductase